MDVYVQKQLHVGIYTHTQTHTIYCFSHSFISAL